MRSGRVFLAGDAAHLNPPFGGHGLNTGLGDAVDLGWKLAAALDGWGGPALLDSYQIERRPIQERVIREATANMAVTSRELLADNLEDDDAAGERARQAASERIQQTKRPEFHSLGLVLGIAIADSPVIVRVLLPGTSGRARYSRTPGSVRAGRCMTSSGTGSRCCCDAPARTMARSSRPRACGASRSRSSIGATATAARAARRWS